VGKNFESPADAMLGVPPVPTIEGNCLIPAFEGMDRGSLAICLHGAAAQLTIIILSKPSQP